MPALTPRAVLADIEMDEQLEEVVEKYKDIELTPDEMTLKIQGDRVIYILNRCLAKLSVVAHLPYLLQNDADLLRKYLKPSESFFVLEVLSEWGLIFDTTDIKNTEYIADYLKLGTVNKGMKKGHPSPTLPEGFPNPQIYQLVDILFYNKCLKNVIRTADNPKVDKHVMSLIKFVQELKEIAKHKVYITGEQQKVIEEELRKAYKSNISLAVVISELKEKLEKQRRKLGKQLNNKLQILEDYEKKLVKLQDNFAMDIKNTLRDSEREMMHKSIESEDKQYDLQDETDAIIEKYEALLKQNLNKELEARNKRLKIETQLQNWINTYDQDIGEKQVQYDELKAQYDDINAQVEHYEQLIREQEPAYNKAMQEKAAEEEKIFVEMSYHFFLDRCAKKIQKYWRRFYEKKRARAGRRGKKKKK